MAALVCEESIRRSAISTNSDMVAALPGGLSLELGKYRLIDVERWSSYGYPYHPYGNMAKPHNLIPRFG